MEEQKPTFQLLHIITTEAYFKREDDINDSYLKAKNNLGLNITKKFDKEDNVGVFLTVDLKQEFEGRVLVEVKVTTAGIFKQNGEIPESTLNSFCDINAPAIIFPFIREIILSLSTKGGLQPIMIQPINFVELSKKDKTTL